MFAIGEDDEDDDELLSPMEAFHVFIITFLQEAEETLSYTLLKAGTDVQEFECFICISQRILYQN